MVIDVKKKQNFDADPKPIQQINFTGNLEPDGDIQMFFIIKEKKETALDLSQETMRVL